MRAAEQAFCTTINNSIGYDGPAPDMMVENCIYWYILENEKVILGIYLYNKCSRQYMSKYNSYTMIY